MPRLVGGELDGNVVAALQVGVPAEVGKIFAFLLSHVVTVGDPRIDHRRPPPLASRLLLAHVRDRITNIVVI